MCALKLWANQQTGGDSLVDTIFEGLLEQSRLGVTNETKEIRIDLEKNLEAIKGGQAQVRQRVLSESSNPRRAVRVDTS